MNARTYVVVSGAVFGLVAILHLLRVLNGWTLMCGPWSIPMWISWGGTVFPALLCVWAWRLASRQL